MSFYFEKSAYNVYTLHTLKIIQPRMKISIIFFENKKEIEKLCRMFYVGWR